MMNISNLSRLAISALTACVAVSSAAAVPRDSGVAALQTIYQFGNLTWLENMAIRSNGHILATDIDKGVIYDLDPNSTPVNPSIVATLPQGSIPAGITEVEPDVFYLNNGMGKALTFTFNANSSSIWKIDMNVYTKTGKTQASKVLDIPPATFLNGIVTVSAEAGVVLVSDSSGGVIYSVNVHKPSYKLALEHPDLKADPNARPAVGVNGLRIRGSSLYFANTNYGYLGTFPISASGVITPTPTLITSSVFAADDFDIDTSGNVWLAENVQNTLVRVTPAGQITVVAGGQNSTALLGPVSARFGRGAQKDTLYVSTDGLSFDPNSHPLTTAGKIVKINTANGGWANWKN